MDRSILRLTRLVLALLAVPGRMFGQESVSRMDPEAVGLTPTVLDEVTAFLEQTVLN